MLGEHPSSLTELHAQKHQVNSQSWSKHNLALQLKGHPNISCTFYFWLNFNQSFRVQAMVYTHEWDYVSVHPNLTLSVDASSDFSLFEALRETIYSEVATLISQNESRPHFLIELFHELQLLNTDYLRQRALYSLQVSVSTAPAGENERQLQGGKHQ